MSDPQVREILGVRSWNSPAVSVTTTEDDTQIELRLGDFAKCHLRPADARTLARHLNRLAKRVDDRAIVKADK